MKFGLDVGTSGAFADVGLLADLAAQAEAAGWDGFFIWDIMLGGSERAPEPVVDPWVRLTAIALATSQIRVGVFMTPLARRRPWDVARRVATLDQLSAGRVIFGAGLGYQAEEFSVIGEDPAGPVRAGKLDEGLAIIDQLWRGQPVSYAGQHYHLAPLTMPTTSTRPRRSADTSRRARRGGLSCVPTLPMSSAAASGRARQDASDERHPVCSAAESRKFGSWRAGPGVCYLATTASPP